MKKRDILGKMFGRLTVIGDWGTAADGHRLVLAKCACGVAFPVRATNLTRPNRPTRSCGCLQQESAKADDFGRLYESWRNMRRRTQTRRGYRERGIGVEPRWQSFALFARDMAATYTPGSHLHRIDPTGHYGPSNCEWLRPHDHREKHRENALAEAT